MKKLLSRLAVYSLLFLSVCLCWSILSYIVSMFNYGLDLQIAPLTPRPYFDFKFNFSFMIIALFVAEIVFQVKKSVDKQSIA